MRFRIFGVRLEVRRQREEWHVWYLGNEGMNQPARNLVIPSEIPESEIAGYLADLLHESATPDNDRVERLD